MPRVLKAVLVVVVVLLGLAVALFEYSSEQDRRWFAAARNECERGCIQDSGGLDQCREFCKGHPDYYP